MGGPGSGPRKGGGSNGHKPETFQIDISKMRKNKLPASIKKKGIGSQEYKDWVKNNWSK